MGASAFLAAACLNLRNAIDFLLAAYVLAIGSIIAVVLLLSPFALVTRAGVFLSALLVLGLTTTAWLRRGRPAPPPLLRAAGRIAHDLRSLPLALLAIAVTAMFAYATALAVATPANDFDVLWYHLARAAYWHQQHAVGYVEHANNVRLNMNPPGAEILSTWAMTLEGTDRFAGVFQIVALLAVILGVLRIACVLGFDRREALLGALLFASLPVVALQAATAGNDVVFSSFIVVTVTFVLVDGRVELGLGALALALAVATKGTVLFALPVLVVLAAALVPRRRWLPVVLAGTIGVAAGGFWYAVNRVQVGSLTPSYEGSNVVEHASRPVEFPAFMARLAIDAVDPAGAVGRDRYLYAVAAALFLGIGLIAAVKARSSAAALAVAASVTIVLLPLAFSRGYDVLLRGYQHVLSVRGDERLAFLGWDREPEPPTPFASWYGPVGLIAFVCATVLVVREVRGGVARRGVLLLTLTPLLYLPVVAATWGYSPWHGRFFMPAVALSATTWGVLLRLRPLAWAVTTAACVALLLSFVHYREKPVGFNVLGGQTPGRSVWSASRTDVIGSWAPRPTAETRLIEELERRAHPGETVALLLRWGDVSYPFYGPGLDRRITYIEEGGEGLDAAADWLVVAPGLDAAQCPSGWRPVTLGEPGWRLYRRVGRCPGESASS